MSINGCWGNKWHLTRFSSCQNVSFRYFFSHSAIFLIHFAEGYEHLNIVTINCEKRNYCHSECISFYTFTQLKNKSRVLYIVADEQFAININWCFSTSSNFTLCQVKKRFFIEGHALLSSVAPEKSRYLFWLFYSEWSRYLFWLFFSE